jgi:hypothetical protein
MWTRNSVFQNIPLGDAPPELKTGGDFFEEIEKVLQISDLFCEICRWEVVSTGRSIQELNMETG